MEKLIGCAGMCLRIYTSVFFFSYNVSDSTASHLQVRQSLHPYCPEGVTVAHEFAFFNADQQFRDLTKPFRISYE